MSTRDETNETEEAEATNPLGMSDEDFLKLPLAEDPEQDQESASLGSGEAEADTQDISNESSTSEEAPDTEDEETSVQASKGDATVPLKDTSQDNAKADEDADSDSPEDASDKEDENDAPEQSSTPDYKGFYEKMMTPFKANGKTIELQTPEEAIQLMQMGANYTRKMQELAPHRKMLLMLENNGLLNEEKISFLIDIEKKNPEALKKLIKDSGVDPLDIDVSGESEYRGGNHKVTDEEVAFTTVLEDLKSNQSGIETLQHINTQWDQASKEVLWNQPELMQVIHAQRENGIYAKITNEMDRRKTLGLIQTNTPFLAAYKALGDELNAAGAFAELGNQGNQGNPAPPASTVQTAPEPVARRTQMPKQTVKNSDKATAASPTRAAPQKTEKALNPLAMSDDDFLKQMANRL